MRSLFLKCFSFTLFVLNLFIVLYIWFIGARSDFSQLNISGPLIALGRLTGLLAFYFILWQLLLIGRTGWIEKGWGHDRLSRFHHFLGITAVAILLFHPILLVIGYSHEAQTTLSSQFFLFLSSYPDMFRAFIAYLLFLGIILTSFMIIKRRLRYETWYFMHIFMYLAVLGAFGHQLTNGHNVGQGWFGIYWQVLFWGVLATVLYYRVIKVAWRFYYHGFYVQDVKSETNDVNSIIIAGKNLDRLKAKAGQFIIVRFLAKGFWWEAHPFSLSEMPDGKRLRITAKAVGDFTLRLSKLPLGSKIIVEGPLGRFTSDRATKGKILLIAGGIGITPLRSLLEEFKILNKDVDLIYAVRSDSDLALKSELDSFVGANSRAHYLPEDKFGRLTPELLKSNVPDINDRYIYLCGPPPMMKVVRQQLASLGVFKSKILYEKFQLG